MQGTDQFVSSHANCLAEVSSFSNDAERGVSGGNNSLQPAQPSDLPFTADRYPCLPGFSTWVDTEMVGANLSEMLHQPLDNVSFIRDLDNFTSVPGKPHLRIDPQTKTQPTSPSLRLEGTKRSA